MEYQICVSDVCDMCLICLSVVSDVSVECLICVSRMSDICFLYVSVEC